MIGQIVSKKRVADHGEVFTSQREVNAMLDMVKHETQRIDSRFLEPACGTGNFLAEILARKLCIVEGRYRQSPVELERYTLLAVTSIYGIDLLLDNVAECRRRLLEMVKTKFPGQLSEALAASIRFVLQRMQDTVMRMPRSNLAEARRRRSPKPRSRHELDAIP